MESILQITLERPSWGCDRIAYYLALSGIKASSPTVQKILITHQLGKRVQREARSAAHAAHDARNPDPPREHAKTPNSEIHTLS